MMIYKGYVGRTEVDDDAGIISGEVVNTKDVITFQGDTVSEVKKAFRESVDDYLAFCHSRGEKPEKPFSGKLVVRMEPDLHQAIYLRALEKGTSLNAFITDCLSTQCAGMIFRHPNKAGHRVMKKTRHDPSAAMRAPKRKRTKQSS